MYAIIATGGKQYKVSEGDIINVEKLAVSAGETVTFDQVVAVNDGTMKAGDDVANATVTASVVKEGRAKKVIVYRYKRKSGYHKKNGHRQSFTQVKIENTIIFIHASAFSFLFLINMQDMISTARKISNTISSIAANIKTVISAIPLNTVPKIRGTIKYPLM